MTNRKLADLVKDQKPLVLAERETVQEACRCMWERCTGLVLVVNDHQRLTGIFTGRDAVSTLAQGKSAEIATLAQAMTPNPITITPDSRQSTRCGKRAIAASVIFQSSRTDRPEAPFRATI